MTSVLLCLCRRGSILVHALYIFSLLSYSDIEKIQAGIGDKIGLFLQYCSTFVTGFVIAFTANWKLTLVLSVTLPILCLLIIAITQVRKPAVNWYRVVRQHPVEPVH